MKNFIQEGNVVEVTLLKDVVSGGLVVARKLFGIATVDGLTGETINVSRKGVYLMPIGGAEVVEQGDLLYADSNNALTLVSTSNLLVGAALSASPNGVTSVELVLG